MSPARVGFRTPSSVLAAPIRLRNSSLDCVSHSLVGETEDIMFL